MRNIAITDESFDSNAASAYHLSIQYCEQFCSFAILDPARMKYVAFRNFWFAEPMRTMNQADHFRSLLNSESLLSRNYQSVHFICLTPVSVLVPVPLFRKENPEVFFKLSSQLEPGDKVLFRKIPGIDSYVLFPVQEDFVNRVGAMLPNVKFFHQSCPQIAVALSGSGESTDRTRVFANINAGFTDLMVMKSDQLLLYNSFPTRNTNDLVFFLLYLYEQFDLSQEESPVILSGFVEMYPGTIDILHRYVKKIVNQEFPKRYTYCDSFSEIAPYQYSQLINLARCE